MNIPPGKWRSREALLQEMDAQMRIRDIRAVYEMKEAMAFRWYEPFLKMIVLLAGIAFAVTFVYFLDRAVDLYGALESEREAHAFSPESLRMVFWFIAAAFSLMLIAGMISLELLLMRVSAMRRLIETQLRVMEHMQGQIEHLSEPQTGTPPPAQSGEGE